MVKSMKKVKRIIAVALVFTMLFASQVTAFAADTKATKSANKDMSIALMPGVTGDSNTVAFNFSGLPDNAIVKEVTVDCSSASVIGGKAQYWHRALQLPVLAGKRILLVGAEVM